MTHLFSCSPPLLPLLLLLHKCLYSPALLFTARVGAVRAQPVCPRGTETGPSAIQCIVLSTAGSPLAAAAEGNKWPSRALTPLTGCELLGDFARGGVNTEEILGSTLAANMADCRIYFLIKSTLTCYSLGNSPGW